MRVAILYSGGKDSTQAIKWALENKHEVVTLIAVKPKNTEAYLYHYATVEWTSLSAEAMNIPLVMLKCNKIGIEEEAKELEKVLKKIKVDAILLGGVGLQKTQIKAIEKIAKKYGIDLVIPYQNYTSEELLREEIKSGLDIRITQVASDGLGPEWLGEKIDKDNFEKLKTLSKKYGFDIDFEGGYADTFVCDAPFFRKRIEFVSTEKIWDNVTNSGYLQVNEAILIDKN